MPRAAPSRPGRQSARTLRPAARNAPAKYRRASGGASGPALPPRTGCRSSGRPAAGSAGAAPWLPARRAMRLPAPGVLAPGGSFPR
ncbi:hypothetical protein G6F60_015585 [Rhizopus arrhizus]|nr:hypothetical protein G6F60_015585 [Rhizopus arrhizus]